MKPDLSDHAVECLRTLARREAVPTQEFNPGVTQKLTRMGFATYEQRASPYQHGSKSKAISHLVITPEGRKRATKWGSL